jgi:tetratricopeptide (TPR) repeat protein
LAKREIFDQIVRNFVSNQGGFFVVSDDLTFVRTFKGLVKALGITQDCFRSEMRSDHYVSKMHSMLKQYKRLVLLVEAFSNGASNTSQFRQIKDALGDRVNIICLSSELNRDVLFLFHEMGADNVIIKPVSMNSVIEKMAYTIKPNNLRNLVDKAKERIAKGDFAGAKAVIDEIFSINPESSIGNTLMGDIYRKAEKFDLAETSYKRASSKARMYLEPLERLAALYEETRNKEKRLEILERMDTLSPLNHKRKIDIGDAYVDMGDLLTAHNYYDSAVTVVRKHSRDQVVASLMEVGKKLMDADPEQGLSYMSEAMEMKSGDFSMQDMWMFNEIGRHLRKEGRWEEAIGYYSNALEIDPENDGLFYNLAMAYLQGKRYFKALEYAQKAVGKNPEILEANISVPFSIARVCFHASKPVEAEKYIQMVLAREPRHRGALDLQRQLLQSGKKR